MSEKPSSRPSRTPATAQQAEFSIPTSSSTPGSGGQHYAVLVRRTRTSARDVHVLIQGEPKDSVEEALEWMLERTEMVMHDLLVKYAKPNEDGCCVM